MGIVDSDSLPGLFGERIGQVISDNLRFRNLLQRTVERFPTLGNTELMVEIKAALAEDH